MREVLEAEELDRQCCQYWPHAYGCPVDAAPMSDLEGEELQKLNEEGW